MTITIFAEIVIRANGSENQPFTFYAHRNPIGYGGEELRSLVCIAAAERGLRVYDTISKQYLVGTLDDLDGSN